MNWLRKWFGGQKKRPVSYRNPLSGPEGLGLAGVPRSSSRRYHNPLGALERLEAREVPATITWTNLQGNGNWNDDLNWTPPPGGFSHVPTANDDVQFDNTSTASV